jgi:hypothetical protein
LKWSLTLPLFSFQRTNAAPPFGANLDDTKTSRLVNSVDEPPPPSYIGLGLS